MEQKQKIEILTDNAFRTIEIINMFFHEYPDRVLNKEDFLEFQKLVWEETKKKYKLEFKNGC